jgi:hypothetical protein
MYVVSVEVLCVCPTGNVIGPLIFSKHLALHSLDSAASGIYPHLGLAAGGENNRFAQGFTGRTFSDPSHIFKFN